MQLDAPGWIRKQGPVAVDGQASGAYQYNQYEKCDGQKVAGVPEDQLTIIPDLTNMTTAIQKLPTKQVYVVATYTAMLQLRKQLASQGIIDGGMA